MIDPVDTEILRLLGENGRMSNSEISRRLEISEATVRQRIKRLIDSGALKISAQIDTKSFPEIFIVIVGIILNILPRNVSIPYHRIPTYSFHSPSPEGMILSLCMRSIHGKC